MKPLHQAPNPLQKAELPLHIGVIPLEIFFRWRFEQNEHSSRIGTVLIDHNSRVDAVVFRLRHLFKKGLQAITGDGIFGIAAIGHIRWGDVFAGFRVFVGHPLHHPLRQQTLEGLIKPQQTPIPQGLGEEARIEQMQNRVLDPAHVLIHRQPAVHGRTAEGQGGVVGIAIAQEIPARTHEGIHGVRFPPGLLAAAGAIHPHPRFQLGQGRCPLAAEGHIPGQFHR